MMHDNNGVLAVVIGRAGSKGLPGKNARLVAGRPMICYAIEHAKPAECVTRVVVSTDGDEIAAAAESMDVEVVRRPPELASDTATVGAAVRHAVQSLGATESIIVILYANVPVRPPDLIDRAVGLLRHSGADSVQSYTDVGKHHPYWMCELDEDQRVKPYVDNTIDRRQDLPKLLSLNGGVIAVTASSLQQAISDDPHSFLGTDRRGIETPPGSVIDVDDLIDLAVAEAVLTQQTTGAVS
ncbi:MAG: acylneuraminate cytidylyltransferase family protein [Phycisphaerales bacterium]